jgi:hypothetical protein
LACRAGKPGKRNFDTDPKSRPARIADPDNRNTETRRHVFQQLCEYCFFGGPGKYVALI